MKRLGAFAGRPRGFETIAGFLGSRTEFLGGHKPSREPSWEVDESAVGLASMILRLKHPVKVRTIVSRGQRGRYAGLVRDKSVRQGRVHRVFVSPRLDREAAGTEVWRQLLRARAQEGRPGTGSPAALNRRHPVTRRSSSA